MSNDTLNKSRPSFKGLSWYREQYFSFFIPLDWNKVNWPDERPGIIFLPSIEDNLTVFATEVQDLGTKLTPDDLTYLNQGFLDGIKQLPDVKIEFKKNRVAGKQLQLEAKYTFTADGETCKRWVRVLYDDTRQVTFTAQGKTVEAFSYWLPMFNEAMMTLTVHATRPSDPPR